MKIINLIEDTQGAPGLHAEHGLSFYVETGMHKILVDTGASDRTWENAERLGIDLEQIDTVFLSHGHYDHAGGILYFAAVNSRAAIYVHSLAGQAYYNLKEDGRKFIGIKEAILQLPQCIRLGTGNYRLDEELSIFSGVTGRRKWPESNLTLKRKDGDRFLQDTFGHEQYLVVRTEGKAVLLSGCAHNGILNILDHYRALYGDMPDLVISGFHMMKKAAYEKAEITLIREIAEELGSMGILFYTGHCTGLPAFEMMEEIMGETLHYVHSGDRIV